MVELELMVLAVGRVFLFLGWVGVSIAAGGTVVLIYRVLRYRGII